MLNSRTNIEYNRPLKLHLFVYITAGVIFGILTLFSYYAAAFATLAIPFVVAVYKSPLNVIAVFMLLIPFSETQYFGINIMGLPGAKPTLLLALFIICVAIINYKKSEKLPKFGRIFIACCLIIFTASFIRSIPNLATINSMRIENLSLFRFVFSDFVKPLTYFLPFIIIVKFARNLKNIDFLSNAVVLSLVSLSLFILYAHLFEISGISDVRAISEYFGLTLGMHRNDLANFYIIGFPIILAKFFMKKNIGNLLSLCLAVAGIGLLYSRTAYIILLLAFILYIIISKRKKLMPILIGIGFAISLIVSSTIIERASTGLDTGDLDKIFAGRVDYLWNPLIKETLDNPKNLIFGNGRYAIFSTDVSKKGIILGASHPHNMYLEQILDTGLLGLFLYMAIFFSLLKKIYHGFRNTADPKLKEYQYAVFISIISYLISGLTGRTLFFTSSNSFFWIYVGIAIVIIKMIEPVNGFKNEQA